MATNIPTNPATTPALLQYTSATEAHTAFGPTSGQLHRSGDQPSVLQKLIHQPFCSLLRDKVLATPLAKALRLLPPFGAFAAASNFSIPRSRHKNVRRNFWEIQDEFPGCLCFSSSAVPVPRPRVGQVETLSFAYEAKASTGISIV